MIRNARTGEEVRFLIRRPELLVMDVTWTKPGHRSLEHRHPGMEERWQVVTGAAAVRIDGVEHRLGPGQWTTASPGTPHLAWNPTDGPVRLTISMRPALRWAEFVERLFAGEDAAGLLDEFADEIVLV